MSFSDTYAEEVLHSRRTRSQRAGFWAKIISFLLMITVAVTLRSEPQLRQAIITAGMDAVAQVSGRSAPASPTASAPAPTVPDISALQALLANAQTNGQIQIAPSGTAAQQPAKPGIKINRHGGTQGNSPRFQSAPDARQPDPTSAIQSNETQGMADQLGQLLKNFNLGQ